VAIRAKKINNLTLQITEKSGKTRNAGATTGTRVKEKNLPDGRTPGLNY
jgi:hypothetical protein